MRTNLSEAPLQPTMTVGELAASLPVSTRVLFRRRIDFCCGGGTTLEEACRRRGLDAKEILKEIEYELKRGSGVDEKSWADRSPGLLIAHILSTYHEPLREELPRLRAMATKVLHVHGSKDPERLAAVLDTFSDLQEELEPHMDKEERILFPWILSGRAVPPGGPTEVMMLEHEQAGFLLERLRELTDNYAVPDGACNTWRALWNGLEALDRELREHIHLENNILFPRALARA